MKRPRFTLTQLMAIVLLIGFAFAMLRNANEFWAIATFNLAIFLNSTALVAAIVRKGRARAKWVGFAVFGWAYLVVDLLPDRSSGSFGFGPIPKPRLLIDKGFTFVQSYMTPTGGFDVVHDQVSHSLQIITSALLGMVVAHYLAEMDDQRRP
jgi:hypothetical protein